MTYFFFTQKTAYKRRISDWSSDVCSSDLQRRFPWHLAPRHMSKPDGRHRHSLVARRPEARPRQESRVADTRRKDQSRGKKRAMHHRLSNSGHAIRRKCVVEGKGG